jgi:hypothetical protein
MRRSPRAGPRVACDVVLAIASVLTIDVSRWPWFQATLTSTGATGWVPAPSGAATGVYAHQSLWVAVVLAAAQIALLAARYYPRGRLRMPCDGVLLVVVSGIVCLLVAADVLLVPRPWARIMTPVGVPLLWEGNPYHLDGATLVMTWSYGATVAVAAAFTSLVAAIASLAFTKRMPRSESARVLAPRASR